MHIKCAGACEEIGSDDLDHSDPRITAITKRDIWPALVAEESDKAGRETMDEARNRASGDSKDAWTHRTRDTNAFKEKSKKLRRRQPEL